MPSTLTTNNKGCHFAPIDYDKPFLALMFGNYCDVRGASLDGTELLSFQGLGLFSGAAFSTNTCEQTSRRVG
jgi:hypothetical protein